MAFTLTTNKGTLLNLTSGTAKSIGTAQNVGDLMIVALFNVNGAFTVTSVSDTLGTTYSNFRLTASGQTWIIFYGPLIATGANSITVTMSGGTNQYFGGWAEFGGTSASGAVVDGTGTSASFAGTSIVTPTITTTGADDLVLNYFWGTGNGSFVVGSPWTDTGITQGRLSYQADVGPGTYTPNGSIATGTNGSLCLAFKASAITHSDSVTGQIVLAGTTGQAKIVTNIPSGALVFGGSVVEAHTISKSDSFSGNLILGGSLISARSGVNAQTGQIILSGSVVESLTRAIINIDIVSGSIIFTGSVSEHQTRAIFDFTYGQIFLLGSVVEDSYKSYVDTPSGTLILSGDGFEQHFGNWVDTPSGILLFSGFLVEVYEGPLVEASVSDSLLYTVAVNDLLLYTSVVGDQSLYHITIFDTEL